MLLGQRSRLPQPYARHSVHHAAIGTLRFHLKVARTLLQLLKKGLLRNAYVVSSRISVYYIYDLPEDMKQIFHGDVTSMNASQSGFWLVLRVRQGHGAVAYRAV